MSFKPQYSTPSERVKARLVVGAVVVLVAVVVKVMVHFFCGVSLK